MTVSDLLFVGGVATMTAGAWLVVGPGWTLLALGAAAIWIAGTLYRE